MRRKMKSSNVYRGVFNVSDHSQTGIETNRRVSKSDLNSHLNSHRGVGGLQRESFPYLKPEMAGPTP